MPRSILGTPTPAVDLGLRPGATCAGTRSTLATPQLQQRLRRTRGGPYAQAMTALDAGTHGHDPAALAAVLQALATEFPDLTLDERPLGIVAACHLGPPYDVHTCDLAGGIVEHFAAGRAMPPVLERARGLACHGAYAFVEVYPDCLRAVTATGAVAVL